MLRWDTTIEMVWVHEYEAKKQIASSCVQKPERDVETTVAENAPGRGWVPEQAKTNPCQRIRRRKRAARRLSWELRTKLTYCRWSRRSSRHVTLRLTCNLPNYKRRKHLYKTQLFIWIVCIISFDTRFMFFILHESQEHLAVTVWKMRNSHANKRTDAHTNAETIHQKVAGLFY